MRIRVLAVGVVLLVAVGGCARAQPAPNIDPGRPDESTAPDALGSPCTDFLTSPQPSPTPSPQPLPSGFVPVSASRCLYTLTTVPGSGSWQVRIEQRATGDLTDLLEALEMPSVSDSTAACSAVGRLPIVITLTDSQGHTAVPVIPTQACGEPLPDVARAILALPWQEVRRTNVRQVQSQLELDTGCASGYKPVVALYATGRNAGLGGGFVLPSGPVELRVCRYRLDPTQTMTGDDNTGSYQAGVLDTAGTLSGSAAARFLAAVRAAPPAKPCTAAQAPFAVVFPVGSPGPDVAVELSGCDRVGDDSGHLRQLDAATVALLTG